tara:strand:- start:146 stop:355 length:210 start_codon:yes stop_codon:yes gene_type:complete
VKNTKILNAETDEELEDVVNLEISVDPFNITAAFLITNPELSLTNVEAQGVHVGDNTIQYDGGTSTSDD